MMRRRHRREEILDAALRCFAEAGIGGTTVGDIRGRAGATTGSLYHFFDGKDALVGALYVDVLRRYQHDLAGRLGRHRTARAGVRAIVEHYLGWVEAHPDDARFLFDARRSEAVAAVDAEVQALNAELLGVVRGWLRPHVDKGEILDHPMDVLLAVVIAPAAAFAREWLAGQTRTELRRARVVLADAAWASLARPGKEDA